MQRKKKTSDINPARNKRILLVGTFLSKHIGVRSVCEDIASFLRSVGWSVIITSEKLDRKVRLFDMLYTIWQKRGCYQVAHVDVYSGSAFIWAEFACQALTFLGKPYILTLHGGNLPLFARRWPNRVRRLLRGAAKVTVPSYYLFHEMHEYCQDLLVIPNTIDLEAYHWRERGPVQPQLIWLRAFHATYNVLMAPKVLAQLKSDFPDVRLVMIGPDKGDGSMQELRRLIHDLQLGDRVTIMGGISKSEVPYWLSQADIFLNTTNFDNTPVTVLEAMASGLCVVSTNVGGLPYILNHGEDALLVPPNSPESMGDQVRQLLRRPDLSRKISLNARKKAESFDRKMIFPYWEKLFNKMARG